MDLFRYIRHILAKIWFWLSQYESSKVNKSRVILKNNNLIERNLIGLTKEMDI